MGKHDIIREIESLIESDSDATPMELRILEIFNQEELESIRDNLLKSKANRSKENDKWFDELVSKDLSK